MEGILPESSDCQMKLQGGRFEDKKQPSSKVPGGIFVVNSSGFGFMTLHTTCLHWTGVRSLGERNAGVYFSSDFW